MEGPLLPVPGLAARESWTPALAPHPLARLKCSPASCPTAGQAAVPGCAHTVYSCAQHCGQCLATEAGTHSPPMGPQGGGVHGGGIPARHLHSPRVPCICACSRMPRVCPYRVCEVHTCTHTCALSAYILCREFPLPVQAVCLPPSPCAGPVPGTVPGHGHPWDPAGSEPQRVPPRLGGSLQCQPLPRRPCAHTAWDGHGQSRRAPAPVPSHAIPVGRPGGCPTVAQAAWLRGAPGAGGHPAPPILCIPQGRGPAKCLWLPALPGLCPLLSCPSVAHKGYRKHEG